VNAIGFGIVALGYYAFIAALLFGSFYWNSWGLWWVGLLVLLMPPNQKAARTDEDADDSSTCG